MKFKLKYNLGVEKKCYYEDIPILLVLIKRKNFEIPILKLKKLHYHELGLQINFIYDAKKENLKRIKILKRIFFKYIIIYQTLKLFHINFETRQAGRGLWAVYYTSPQNLIIKLSYSLAQQF